MTSQMYGCQRNDPCARRARALRTATYVDAACDAALSTNTSRMIRLRFRTLALASTALSIIGCGSSNADPAPASAPPADAAVEATVVTHTTTVAPPGDEAGASQDTDASASVDAGADDAGMDATMDAAPATPSAFIRPREGWDSRRAERGLRRVSRARGNDQLASGRCSLQDFCFGICSARAARTDFTSRT